MVTTVGRVPVVEDDGRLLGIVTRTDLLRLRNYYGGELPRPSASACPARRGPGKQAQLLSESPLLITLSTAWSPSSRHHSPAAPYQQ